MDCKTFAESVDVVSLPWAAVETNILRAGRGVVGTEQGDLVYTAGGLFGVLTNSKTMTVNGETITESYAKVDFAKNKIRTTAFYDKNNVPAAAGNAVNFATATGLLTSAAVTTGIVKAGIFLGVDNGVMSFMLV